MQRAGRGSSLYVGVSLTWMVVIELILGQNLLGQFFTAWQGTTHERRQLS